MDQILSELGVVNEVEEELRLQLQSLVEENERQLTPSAAAAATTAGDYNNGNDISSKCNKETKKTAIMSILEGANSAQEVSSSKIHSQRKIYKRDEKVKFIADLEDIPNTHDNEMKFNGGKRGYYDSSTSLNLFSSCSQGGMYEYRSSTNVDQNALRELVREAKKRRIQSSTSCSSHTASVASIDNGYPLQDRADSVESDVNSNDGTATSPDQLLSKDVDQATAPPHDQNSFIISDNSDDVSGEVMCPICNRSIANSNAPSNAALIDRHIERCARRGSRNIRNYDEDFSEQSQSVHSASASAGASTSDRSRGGRSSRGQQAAGRRAIVSYPDPDEEEDGSAGESDWESMGATRSTRAQSQRAIITPSGSASSFECDAATSAAPRTSSSSANSRPSTRSAHVPVAASFGFAPAALSRSSKKKNVAAVHSHHAAVYGEETVASFAEEEDEDSQNDDDDAVGFVASITDDWEDHIYDARLVTQASQAAAVAHKKKHAKKNETHGEHIANNVNGDANLENQSEYVRTDYGTEVLRTTWESLHQYQRDGCRWLHGLYDEGVGGILGDEMGK